MSFPVALLPFIVVIYLLQNVRTCQDKFGVENCIYFILNGIKLFLYTSEYWNDKFVFKLK